ncbi:hypothetical protein Fleli_2744 [Bernardetia litoralis DSM 6794]|uniref:Uncharacterized protein n=1 Tax=Bernardetia litoralis (strain ATCC 23117 / DSM 6794 / NBRC 15988 / NCIMB 1366 / Fx l1 / Sio-4) TaxID=880071 RepID=I4AMB3_BERLS|nr:hypothetical protein [Bernardetia litoralis]AFM05098.1 hypothetical protein Fleli_2744 [Bernardetia litoralis DSM 6794]
MKLIRKFNPFNPILPAFCLLIAFAWVGYDSFFREKYSEEEKIYFSNAIGGIEVLSYNYQKDADKLLDIDWYFGREYCIEQNYYDTQKKAKLLKRINANLARNNFYDVDFTKEIPIRSTFESYIKEASELDTLLAARYDNFELENGFSNKEINLKYFSYDSSQSKYHFARFKLEFVKMYYEDVEFLLNQRIKKVVEKVVNPIPIPYIVDRTGEIHLSYCYSFETKHTKITSPKNLKTQFNENGHLIIPSSLRNKSATIGIRIKCSQSDTTHHYIQEYEN